MRLYKVEISSICRAKLGQRISSPRPKFHFVRRRVAGWPPLSRPDHFSWIESRDELRISGSLSYCAVYHRRHSRLETVVFRAQEKKPRVKSDSRGPSRAALPRDGAKEARGSNAKAPANPTEQECPACNGTGYPVVTQPVYRGAKSILRRARSAAAKGRITEDAN